MTAIHIRYRIMLSVQTADTVISCGAFTTRLLLLFLKCLLFRRYQYEYIVKLKSENLNCFLFKIALRKQLSSDSTLVSNTYTFISKYKFIYIYVTNIYVGLVYRYILLNNYVVYFFIYTFKILPLLYNIFCSDQLSFTLKVAWKRTL